MKKPLFVAIGFAGAVIAQAASADLYRLSDRIGLGASAVFNYSGANDIGFGMHGDYSVGLYSWSTSIYAQTDFSVDIFQTDVQALNWSLIVTRDFGTYKLGGLVGALMSEDAEIFFSAGVTGMFQLGTGTFLQGEIGALTNGRDGEFFQNNLYFGQIRVDYELNDTYGVYAKYSHAQIEDAPGIDRGVIGITYSDNNSPWMLNAGVGAFHDVTGFQPLLSAEFKYEFGGDTLPQQPSKLAGTYFDKFEIFDFNIQ